MRIATARVVAGKLEIEGEPLEEGAVVTVLVRDNDESFELSSEDEAALLVSLEQATEGRFIEAGELLRSLRP